MKWLKKYQDETEYTNNKDKVPVPRIIKVQNTSGTQVKWGPEDIYKYEYLTFTALEAGTFTLTLPSALTVAQYARAAYSLDDGANWTTLTNVASQSVTITTPTVNAGDKVLWRGYGSKMDTQTSATNVVAKFSSTGQFNVSGNVMSMIYEDDFSNKTVFKDTCSLEGLFMNCTGLINAANLVLAASTLKNYDYMRMFYGCTSLIAAPKLNAAKTIPVCGYANMFQDCTSLTEAPRLPATTLSGNYAYSTMFRGCTALVKPPIIAATTMSGQYAMQYMFCGCSSLTTPPEIHVTSIPNYGVQYMFQGCTSLRTTPAFAPSSIGGAGMYYTFDGCTSLVDASNITITSCVGNISCGYMFRNCSKLTNIPNFVSGSLGTNSFQYMFQGCTSLVNGPATLPYMTLGSGCYQYMFSGCTKLVNPPTLPATTLASSCYLGMFNGCTALVTAPDLNATTGASNCYQNMFVGCTALKNIKMMATTNVYKMMSTWAYNLPTSGGTFTMNGSAEWYIRGCSGIPNGWTIQYVGDSTTATTAMNNILAQHSETLMKQYYLKTTALTSGTITFTIAKSVQTWHYGYIEYSTDNGANWTSVTNVSSTAKSITTPTLAVGAEVLWRGGATPNSNYFTQISIGTNSGQFSMFSSTCDFAVSGNLASLLDPMMMSNTLADYSQSYTLGMAFINCTKLKSVQNLQFLDNMGTYGYSHCFKGCTGLTAAPSLPMTHLNTGVYYQMFYGCTGLTSAPATLPATSLSTSCYEYMFYGCTALTTAPVLPATAGVNYAYRYMFQNCSSLNYIKCMLIYTSAGSTAAHMTNWVSGVSATGTFVKNSASNNKWSTTGVSGIPSGWTVQTAAS